MSTAPTHPSEHERLAALRALNIVDTPPEESYDELVQLASQICEVPISHITFLENDRQWFKAKVGIELEETPLEHSICAHCILQDEILVIEDARNDPRFSSHPMVVGGLNIRFYAGAPITTQSGFPVGTLCVVDTRPRSLNDKQKETLRVLASQVGQQLELRLSNKLLEEAKKSSEQLNQNLKQLIRVIGHDLRNPLSGLMSLTEMLSADHAAMSTDEQAHVLSLLNNSTHQAFALLENMLEWSSSEADMIRFQPEQLYLNTLAKQVEEIVAPMVQQKKIELITRIPPDLLIRMDGRMIASVLRNLLTNALKFSNKHGKVVLEASQSDGMVTVSVRDEGVGMEPAQIEHILTKGPNSSTYGTSGEKGSGIGINLIHNFLEQHGAKLRIESKPDKGTTASFTIPVSGKA